MENVELAAKVLKNTEETKVEDLKSSSFEDIIKKCSMTFSSIYKLLLMDYLAKDNEKSEEKREKLAMQNRFLPIMHQLEVLHLLGTVKMSIVVKESIEQKLNNENVSDYEKFITVFLYADIKEEGYLKYIAQLIKNTKRTYINDMLLFKVVSYYYLRSKNKDTDTQLENLLGEIKVKSRKSHRKSYGKSEKAKFIEDFRRKRRVLTEDDDSDYQLDA
jgi:hypothetical protein